MRSEIVLASFTIFLIMQLTTSLAHSPDTIIIITDDGFSPDTIDIHVGTKVTWVNKGNAQHWPASDVHPTHKLYPGSGIEKCGTVDEKNILDACHGLEGSGRYTFTFNKPGRWSVHDHLYPGLTMLVEVTEESQRNLFSRLLGFFLGFFKKTQVQFPSSESFLSLEYVEQLNSIKELSKSDAEESWKYLKKTFAIDGQIKQNPHEFAHIVGNEIYRQKGFKGVSVCDPTFAFGCYHGVTEKMLLALGVKAIPKVEQSCLNIFTNESQLAASCIHGIGHGLLTWEGLNVKKALKHCDMLVNQYRIYCYDGVFMEHSLSAPSSKFAEKKWEFCASFDEKYQPLCAKYQIYPFVRDLGWNFSQAVQFCDESPNEILKENCFSGLGYSATNAAHGDGNEIKRLCSLAIGEDRYLCIIHAAKEVIFQEYANWWEVSDNLCEGLPNEWKTICLNKTKETIEGYNKKIPSEPVEIQEIRAADNLDEQVKLYKNLIERVGVEQAQEYLYRSGLPFTGQTHLLNHVAGDHIYENYGAGGLVKCKDYFLASCYHGFVLHAIAVDGIEGLDKIVNECKKFGVTVTSQCSHAIGHGFLAWVGYGKLNEGAEMCDEMTKRVSDFPGFNCRDGVFMENIWGVHSGEPSKDRWINANDSFYPCNDARINPNHLDGCWSNQPSLMYQMFKGNLTKVGEECLKVVNSTHQKTCFNALARQIHPLTKGNVDSTFQLCNLLPSTWVNYCATTVALSDFSVGGRDSSYKICAGINESGKKECYSSLYGVMAVYSRSQDEYRKFCQDILEEKWRC